MAVAHSDEQLASVPKWLLSLTGTYVARLLVWGVLMIAAGAFALLTIPRVYPEATPFLWLAVLGLLVPFIEFELTDEESDAFATLMERFLDQPRKEQIFYAFTMFVILIGMVSFQIAVIGVVSAYLATSTGLGILAIFLAIWYPSIDVWAGRKLGFNVASVGAIIALGFMILVAKAYDVSPSVPRTAAADVRASF